MSDEIKRWIVSRMRKDKSIGVFLRFEKGKIFWIPQHHRYLSHEYILAQKVYLGKGEPPKGVILQHGMFAYIIEPIK